MPNLIRFYSILSILMISVITTKAQVASSYNRSATKRVTVNHAEPASLHTKAINTANVCEAYPYLSADGLRLYFTSNREGGHGRFFISTRKNTSEAFSKPTVLSKNLTDGYYCSSLTADELTLCMVRSGEVYISVRKTIQDEFKEPVKVNGFNNNFHYAPTLSPDASELIIVETRDSKDQAICFKRVSTNEYVETGHFDLLDDKPANPGQLSKDGLTYYTSVEKDGNETLYSYTRKTLNEHFSNLQPLNLTVKGFNKLSQPTVNGDGTIFMCISSPDNLWQSDDILLIPSDKKINEESEETTPTRIQLPVATVIEKKTSINSAIAQPLHPMEPSIKEAMASLKMTEVSSIKKTEAKSAAQLLQFSKVYPVPFKNDIYIELQKLPAAGAWITLSDLNGKVIVVQKLPGLINHITVNNIAAGTYVYQVTTGNRTLVTSGKLVKL